MKVFVTCGNVRRNRATSQPRNSAANPFAVNQLPSAAAGLRATILRTPPIIAGVPSVNGAMSSASRWLDKKQTEHNRQNQKEVP